MTKSPIKLSLFLAVAVSLVGCGKVMDPAAVDDRATAVVDVLGAREPVYLTVQSSLLVVETLMKQGLAEDPSEIQESVNAMKEINDQFFAREAIKPRIADAYRVACTGDELGEILSSRWSRWRIVREKNDELLSQSSNIVQQVMSSEAYDAELASRIDDIYGRHIGEFMKKLMK